MHLRCLLLLSIFVASAQAQSSSGGETLTDCRQAFEFGFPDSWEKTFLGMKVGVRAVEARPEELHSELLSAEAQEEMLFQLVRYTGYVPEVVVRNKIVSEREMAVAYPFQIGHQTWRLLVEYKYVPAITANPDYEDVVPRPVPAMLMVDKVFLVSPDAIETDVIDLMTRRTPTLVVVNGKPKPRLAEAEKLISKYWERVEKITKDEGKHRRFSAEERRRETESLIRSLDENGSSANERLLQEIEILARPLSTKEPFIGEQLLSLSEDLLSFTVFSKVTGGIIEQYRTFMAAYLYTANRNSLARPIEDLQNLTRVEQFKALKKSIALENIKSTLWERTVRTTLGAPAGLAIGAVVGVMGAVGAWNTAAVPSAAARSEYIPAAAYVESKKNDRPVEVRFHNNQELTFVVLRNKDLVPENPYLSLWQQDTVSLVDANGVTHEYGVTRHLLGDGDVSVILSYN